MPRPDNKRPARTAIAAHDHLRAVNKREPDSDREPDAWLAWHRDDYQPAYESWSQAMDQLTASGYDGSRHPSNFRPYCLDILASLTP